MAGTVLVNCAQTNAAPDGLAWATAFDTVQAGIDAAAAGDEVWVATGTYSENLTLRTGIALYGGFAGTESARGERDVALHAVILDGSQSNSVVTIGSGADSATRVDGFTIRNGSASYGGGVFCADGSPVVANNYLLWNTATSSGGGIYCSNAAPVITNNVIFENMASLLGAGIACAAASPIVHNNRIVGNNLNGITIMGGGGIGCRGESSPSIANNLLLANAADPGNLTGQGGGIYCDFACRAQIVNNTILGSDALTGAGIGCRSNLVTIANNIIANGTSGIRAVEGLTFRHNCVFGNGATNYHGLPDLTGTDGNISVDPGFVILAGYPTCHLTAESPCRDQGDAGLVSGDWLDIDGQSRVQGPGVDMGADEIGTAVPEVQPPTLRVKSDGDDNQDGLTWATAKRSIQVAIDGLGVNGGEVWVQAGIYPGPITMRQFVYLYGGFAGSETKHGERNPTINETILDGNQAGTVVVNSFLQQWGAVDGFVIQNGYAPRGAGVYSWASRNLLANNVIQGNVAPREISGSGGGVYVRSGALVISNNVIRLNQAKEGGGVYCATASAPLLVHNTIVSNSVSAVVSSIGSPGGGGIHVRAASPTIRDNLICDNVASNTASVRLSGGGICCSSAKETQILNNTLLRNRATVRQGSVTYDYGGGIFVDTDTVRIANNLVAWGSSGIQVSIKTPQMRNNCLFGHSYSNYVGIADLTGTDGNISADPLLVDPATDFHLQTGSPCINAGDGTVVPPGDLDFDRHPRIAGGQVDIGAYEFGLASLFRLGIRWGSSSDGPWLELTGETGQSYIFEASVDLTTWTGFSTNVATNGVVLVSDPTAADSGGRFYRAVTGP